jgi:hypothetical protein
MAQYKVSDSIKISRIISGFEGINPDPRLIAEKNGFSSHIEMAEFMKKMKYKWSSECNNYVKSIDEINNKAEFNYIVPDKEDQEYNIADPIDTYIPFLKFLYNRKDEICELLSNTCNSGKIPRYTLSGIVRTKAIYMNDSVANLAMEFSKEKNITQREIFEAAIIEYLQKYGYKEEVEAILEIK